VVGHVDDRHLAPSKRTACAISTGAVREDRVVGGVAHAVDLEKRFARPTSAATTTPRRCYGRTRRHALALDDPQSYRTTPSHALATASNEQRGYASFGPSPRDRRSSTWTRSKFGV